MSSSWSKKLETRLSALADSASKESIQTLAKWMGFNRKHGPALASALANALSTSGSTRQWLYLQVIHEALMLDNGSPQKWERLADLRTTLGETAIVPSIEVLTGENLVRVSGLVEQWDDNNVFGGPTLLAQIRKAMSSPAKMPSPPSSNEPTVSLVKTATTSESGTTEATGATRPEAMVGVEESGKGSGGRVVPVPVEEPGIKQSNTEQKAVMDDLATKPTEVQGKSTLKQVPVEELKPENSTAIKAPGPVSVEPVKFDFESEGIPYEKVDAREFLDPCKAVATIQIAREIRNDAAVRLSSYLSDMPEDAQKTCREAWEQYKKTGEPPKITEEQAEALSLSLSDDVLDVDLEEALQNVQTFRDLVQKQRAARKQLVHLLIRSRCQFGSQETAEAFYKLEDTIKLLQKRKELLLDAMALEGLDFEEGQTGESIKEVVNNDLEPLSWYDPSEPEAKKARIEKD